MRPGDLAEGGSDEEGRDSGTREALHAGLVAGPRTRRFASASTGNVRRERVVSDGAVSSTRSTAAPGAAVRSAAVSREIVELVRPTARRRSAVTCPWHERDARSLAALRLQRAGDRSSARADEAHPDVAWLQAERRRSTGRHLFSAGDRADPTESSAFSRKGAEQRRTSAGREPPRGHRRRHARRLRPGPRDPARVAT